MPDAHLPYIFRKTADEWKILEIYDRWFRGGKLAACELGCENCEGDGCGECLCRGCEAALLPPRKCDLEFQDFHYDSYDFCEAGLVYHILAAYVLTNAAEVISVRGPPDSPSILTALGECKLDALPSTGEVMRKMVADGQARLDEERMLFPGRRFGMTMKEDWKICCEEMNEPAYDSDADSDYMDEDSIGLNDYGEFSYRDD